MRMTPQESSRYARPDVLLAQTFGDPASPEGQKRSVRAPQSITGLKPEKILSVYPVQVAEAGVRAGEEPPIAWWRRTES